MILKNLIIVSFIAFLSKCVPTFWCCQMQCCQQCENVYAMHCSRMELQISNIPPSRFSDQIKCVGLQSNWPVIRTLLCILQCRNALGIWTLITIYALRLIRFACNCLWLRWNLFSFPCFVSLLHRIQRGFPRQFQLVLKIQSSFFSFWSFIHLSYKTLGKRLSHFLPRSERKRENNFWNSIVSIDRISDFDSARFIVSSYGSVVTCRRKLTMSKLN